MLKIAMIPIDNRPVCYCLPNDIGKFCDDIEIITPPRTLLGGLTSTAQTDELLNWLEQLKDINILVIALDTIAYGGLVPSRRINDSFEQIKTRLEKLTKIIKNKQIKTYACSSIMRISNNNINEEEKEYWNTFGKKIFDYSFNLHKAQKEKSYDSNAKFSCIRQVIPTHILEDYFNTRKRNFEINKLYLQWQKEGIFEYLVFSKDDCAQYGINVSEAEEIQNIINNENLNAIVKTGADEIPLSLMARALLETKNKKLKIYPQFLQPTEINLISKYEDVSIYNSVKGQIELCGCQITKTQEDADLILLINNFKKEQGELVMGVNTEPFYGELELPNKPYFIADVMWANGADNNFVNKLFEKQIDFNNYCGFTAWNTSANSLGSAIFTAVFKSQCQLNLNAFKQQQFIRFADDWAYQANGRAQLKTITLTPNEQEIEKLMRPFTKKIEKFLDFEQKKICYNFPWNRFFEIEIIVSEID